MLLLKIDTLIEQLRKIACKFGSPLLDLSFRLYLANAFFISGIGRFKSYLNGDWETQLFLFDFEHPVPGISAHLAAPITTIAELTLPILLAAGLFSRFSAAGIFVMALVIQLTYQENYQHLLWMALALSVFIKGPGVLSIDHLLVKWIRKEKTV